MVSDEQRDVIFLRVRAAFNEVDPCGLIQAGFPDDEYNPEGPRCPAPASANDARAAYDPSLVGLSSEWVGVRAPTDAKANQAVVVLADFGDAASPPFYAASWVWASTRDAGGSSHELMQRVASVLREPALGGRIIDSDNAALYGSDANGKLAFEFPINDWNLDDLDAVESRLRESWLVPDQRRAAAERLASWSSSYAPQAVTPELLLAGMPGHGSTEAPTDDIYFGQMPSAWTLDSEDEWDGGYAPGGEWYRGGGAWLFAEDGIRFLFARLGLDSICNDVWNAA